MRRFTKCLLTAALCAALGVAAVATDFFQAADANQDGYITRAELRGAMTQWLGGRERVEQKELTNSLDAAFPEWTFMGMISPPQRRTRKPEEPQKLAAALPVSSPAKRAQP